MSTDWDIDSYKTEYENEEHWELRKNFMLAHKDKFPEDELVCLAQVFTNIEFLGCRYPEKTMIRVAELARGVVESFREKRKDSLKRTFVAASDAASAKVKGQVAKVEPGKEEKKEKEVTETESTKKVIESPKESTSQSSKNYNKKINKDIKRCKYGGVKTFEIQPIEQVDGQPMTESDNSKESETEVECGSDFLMKSEKLKKFVLMLDENEHPINMLQLNASLNKCPIRWKVSQGVKTCKVYLNNECVGMGTGLSKKASKEKAARVALANLRESHYGIKMKKQPPETIPVNPKEMVTGATPSTLGEDNVGRKLMKLMGWQGGGLGSKEQGIKQPVGLELHVRREGLGLKNSSYNMRQFKKHAREYIQSWAESSAEEKLVFSAHFSSEERSIMHEIAKNLGLRSKSYGKEENRYLVIWRRPDPVKILETLLKTGNSDMYELLTPTKC